MATPYTALYGTFFSKVTDYDLPNMQENTIHEYLHDLMISALTRFEKVAVNDLSDRDEEEKQFNSDLSDLEIDIITEIMIENWIRPKLYNTDLLRQNLGTKDFSVFSNANMLNSIREIYNNAHARSESMINRYSFETNDVRKLGKDSDN